MGSILASGTRRTLLAAIAYARPLVARERAQTDDRPTSRSSLTMRNRPTLGQIATPDFAELVARLCRYPGQLTFSASLPDSHHRVTATRRRRP